MTRLFPREEIYGLTQQMRRAAVSVPANIAEAFGRKGPGDKARLLNISQASLDELRYFFILSQDLGYADTNAVDRSAEEVGKMLGAYSRKIRP